MIEFLGDFPRGGTVRFALDFVATEGEVPSDIELVEADCRFAGARPEAITAAMPLVGAFAIEARDDDAGWFATIENSGDMQIGYHVIDIRLSAGGEPNIGPPACFRITEAVTRRPA